MLDSGQETRASSTAQVCPGSSPCPKASGLGWRSLTASAGSLAVIREIRLGHLAPAVGAE